MNLLTHLFPRLRMAHKLNRRADAAGTGLHTYSSMLQVQYRKRRDVPVAAPTVLCEMRVHSWMRVSPRDSRLRRAAHAALRWSRHEYVCSDVSVLFGGAYHPDAPMRVPHRHRPRRRSAEGVIANQPL
jgi:hypothetical protein